MVKRTLRSFVLCGVAFSSGCGGKDPGGPSVPRVVSTPVPAPTPEPLAIPSPPGIPRKAGPPPAAPEEPLHVGGDVSEPVAIVQVLPDCRALTGAPVPVAVELVVTREGAVQSARVLSAIPDSARGLVLESVRGWRFRPATFRGRPVAVIYTVALRCT